MQGGVSWSVTPGHSEEEGPWAISYRSSYASQPIYAFTDRAGLLLFLHCPRS